MNVSDVVRLSASLALGAALAAGAMLPGIALAQGVAPAGLPQGALLVVDGDGQPIGLLMPATQRVTQPDPMAEMMALQGAMMRQMQAQMAGLTQAGLAQAADGTTAGGAPALLVIRSVTTGPDGCSRTVVWRQGAADAAPKMVLNQVADRCAGGRDAPRTPQGVRQQAPAAAAAVPALQTIVDLHAPAKPAAGHPF